MKNKTVTRSQRIRVTKAYVQELDRVCTQYYKGDWDKMPKNAADAPVDYLAIAKNARLSLRHPAGIAALVRGSVSRDDILEAAL